jgi:hypothetical protein
MEDEEVGKLTMPRTIFKEHMPIDSPAVESSQGKKKSWKRKRIVGMSFP